MKATQQIIQENHQHPSVRPKIQLSNKLKSFLDNVRTTTNDPDINYTTNLIIANEIDFISGLVSLRITDLLNTRNYIFLNDIILPNKEDFIQYYIRSDKTPESITSYLKEIEPNIKICPCCSFPLRNLHNYWYCCNINCSCFSFMKKLDHVFNILMASSECSIIQTPESIINEMLQLVFTTINPELNPYLLQNNYPIRSLDLIKFFNTIKMLIYEGIGPTVFMEELLNLFHNVSVTTILELAKCPEIISQEIKSIEQSFSATNKEYSIVDIINQISDKETYNYVMWVFNMNKQLIEYIIQT